MAGLLSIMRRVVTSLLQYFPLTVFLRVAFLHGEPQAEEWLNAFLAGGATALLQFIVATMLRRGRPLNRMMMGVNAYLILGGAAVLGNQLEVLNLLNDLRESGIFLCLLTVGVVTTWRSRAGFIGEESEIAQAQMLKFSLWMLMLTCAATAASFYFRGHLIFSAVIPMIGLAVVNKVFKKRLQRIADVSDKLSL